MEGTTRQAALIKASTTGLMTDSDDSSGSSSQNVADLMLGALRDIIKDIRHRLPDPRYRTCQCGQGDCIYFCDVTQWLLPEMQYAIQPLEESYLALGEVYKEHNQLDQSVKVVKVPYQLNQLIGSTCSFLPRAWLLIGEVHFECYLERSLKRCNSDCPCKSERQHTGKWASTSERTFEDSSEHMSLLCISKFDQVASELISGDIVQFLSISTNFDNAEDHIPYAMHCYKEARKAAAMSGTDESTELKLLKKTSFAWIELGRIGMRARDYDAAGEALSQAGRLLKEATDNKTRAELLCHIGDLVSSVAEELREGYETSPPIFPVMRFLINKLLSSFYSEARDHYELSREALPGSVDICEKLAMLEIDQRKPFLDSDHCQSRTCSPNMRPHLYLQMLLALLEVPWCLSNLCYLSNTHDQTKMQRACLELLLGAHHVNEDGKANYKDEDGVVVAFWKRLQFVLKNMLLRLRSGDGAPAEERKKLSSMYAMSLRTPTFAKLHAMEGLWSSV